MGAVLSSSSNTFVCDLTKRLVTMKVCLRVTYGLYFADDSGQKIVESMAALSLCIFVVNEICLLGKNTTMVAVNTWSIVNWMILATLATKVDNPFYLWWSGFPQPALQRCLHHSADSSSRAIWHDKPMVIWWPSHSIVEREVKQKKQLLFVTLRLSSSATCSLHFRFLCLSSWTPHNFLIYGRIDFILFPFDFSLIPLSFPHNLIFLNSNSNIISPEWTKSRRV